MQAAILASPLALHGLMNQASPDNDEPLLGPRPPRAPAPPNSALSPPHRPPAPFPPPLRPAAPRWPQRGPSAASGPALAARLCPAHLCPRPEQSPHGRLPRGRTRHSAPPPPGTTQLPQRVTTCDAQSRPMYIPGDTRSWDADYSLCWYGLGWLGSRGLASGLSTHRSGWLGRRSCGPELRLKLENPRLTL
jgi:hypothetical protein